MLLSTNGFREVVPNRFLGTNVFITDSQNIAMSQTLSCTCALKNISVQSAYWSCVLTIVAFEI